MIMNGDLYFADLEPVIGSEQGGIRPVLIVSNDVGNKHSPTVIIAPVTSRAGDKSKLPIHVELKAFDKIKQDSVILIEQARAIDKRRLKAYLCKINSKKKQEVNNALIIEFGIHLEELKK
jgi:Growth inhibitor